MWGQCVSLWLDKSRNKRLCGSGPGLGGRNPLSQVLVGVALVLAVRPKVEERQLLVAALQLEDFAAQVQTALRTGGEKNSSFHLKIRAELRSN